MSHVNLYMQGRFGNQCCQYLAARGYCERHGYSLHTQSWVGQALFQIDDPRIISNYPKRNESALAGNEHSISLSGYFQNQLSVDQYTRTQARQWFTWNPKIRARLEKMPMPAPVLIHRRKGDYLDLNYPVPSDFSHLRLIEQMKWTDFAIIEEAHPHTCDGFVGELAFVPDFWLLTQAKVLVRANSTFSFIAALLSDAEIFCPIVDGLPGGVQDVNYISGNHCRFCNLDFISDLHLRP